MPARPSAVAFDVIGPLFPLDPLREPLVGLGLPPQALEIWFARTLPDGFALGAAGAYRPFVEVATGTLEGFLAQRRSPGQSPGICATAWLLEPVAPFSPAARTPARQ